MRRLWLFLAFVALPLVAWGLSLNVSFRLPPLLNKIRPVAVVDEVGNVLFGSTPAKVEVTNLPNGGSGGPQLVTIADALPVTCSGSPPVWLIPTNGFRHLSILGSASYAGSVPCFCVY